MLVKRIVAMSFLGLLPYHAFSQIKQPQVQSSAGFQPVNMSTCQAGSYPQQNRPATAPQYPNAPIKMGGTAEDVITSTNHSQSLAINTAVAQKQQEVQQLIRNVQAEQKRFGGKELTANNRPVPNPERTKDFPAALKHLEDMLTGKAKLSVADAYYTVEAAYGNPYLTRQQYNDNIKESAAFIRTWMLENKLNPKDNYMVQYAIRKFMSETLTISYMFAFYFFQSQLQGKEVYPLVLNTVR